LVPEILIHPIEANQADALGIVLAESFHHDDAMRRFVACRPGQFPAYFSWVAGFFLASGRYYAWVATQEEQWTGAALCIPSRWSAPPSLLRRYLVLAWQINRWNSLRMGWNMLRYAALAGYGREALSLTFLGVLPAYRGQAIGRKLLRHVLCNSPFPSVQLEVEADNQAAVSLYASEGFYVCRRFSVAGMKMQVMRWDRQNISPQMTPGR
jgi:ribosomal protein S18 acetylase RimI-like enzyme